MIQVSQKFLQATKSYTRISTMEYVITYLDGTSITLNDTNSKGNCTITNQCVTSNGFNIGGVCIGECSFTMEENSIYIGNLIGATVKIFTSLYTDKDEKILIGTFIITKAEKSNGFVTISGSDNMMKLDKSFYDEDTYNNRVNTIAVGLSNLDTLYNHINYICNQCGATMPYNEDYIQSFELYEHGESNLYRVDCDNVNASPRDYLSNIATLLGGFFYVNNLGYITPKRFGTDTDSVYTVEYSQIISNGYNECDFQMRLYGAYYQDEDNSWCKTWYPAYENLPNSIIVDTSNNMFLQQYYQDHGLPQDIIGNICLAVGGVSYIPFDISIIGNPALEVGDCITIQRKDGSYFKSVITHISWTSRGTQNLKCVGEDARTLGSNVRNQTTRLAETTQKKINDVKGVDLSQSEFDNMSITDLKEGKTYYVY